MPLGAHACTQCWPTTVKLQHEIRPRHATGTSQVAAPPPMLATQPRWVGISRCDPSRPATTQPRAVNTPVDERHHLDDAVPALGVLRRPCLRHLGINAPNKHREAHGFLCLNSGGQVRGQPGSPYPWAPATSVNRASGGGHGCWGPRSALWRCGGGSAAASASSLCVCVNGKRAIQAGTG